MSSTLSRLTSYLPIRDSDLHALYQRARAIFWTEDEVDLVPDLADWEKLSDTERTFVCYVLGFFVQSDQLVNNNIGSRFLIDIEEIPTRYSTDARLFYNFQVAVEDIHTLTYETLINELIADPSQQDLFKNAIANIPVIAQKAEWAVRYTEDKKSSFLVRLIAFAILEGIFFSGSFCAIFWLGKRNLMPGLLQSNKMISRDENLHYEFALTLFRKLRNDVEYAQSIDEQLIRTMVADAVEIESQFINESISCDMIGMNVREMRQYIQFVADILLHDIGMEPMYGVANPFTFMDELGICDRVNFFEQRETVYQKPVAGTLEYDSDSELDF